MNQTPVIDADHSAPKSFVDSTDLLESPEELRARGYEDGYLFFKGLLPAAEVLDLRADILGVLAKYGWLKDGLSGLADVDTLSKAPDEAMRLDIGVSTAIYDDVQRLESFHRFPHHPELLALYRTLFGTDVLVHARHIARIVTPHPNMTPTPIHQDFPHIQGTGDTWTCWFPLSDCPRNMGPLTVLRGSHKNGYLPVQPAAGAGGIEAQLCPWEREWLEADFEAGDVLTFTSYTVHKALPPSRRDIIRVSLDVRYQSVDQPVDPSSLRPHCELPWEEIYAGWQSDELKFYWEKLPLTFSDFDTAYHVPGRRIC